MKKYLTVLLKVLPILVLVMMGYILRRLNFFKEKETVIVSLKKLVLNIGLPSFLFTAFSTANFNLEYFSLFASSFGICILLLFLGKFLKKPLKFDSEYFPMLMTGFEAGMIGYALYAATFGVERLYEFALLNFGLVAFIFSVLVSLVYPSISDPFQFLRRLRFLYVDFHHRSDLFSGHFIAFSQRKTCDPLS
ncbi:MAG: Auxin Efflux Carrier [Thermotoga petrophila]|uniref:Auxin Efflux Carrier n=1 Tax=Thermotoga petrophila TaxID=93929 RepID=A0A101EQB1_9THEM|nr:MAG: Auxin Efflux Carrier [Thermotoga petrophila]